MPIYNQMKTLTAESSSEPRKEVCRRPGWSLRALLAAVLLAGSMGATAQDLSREETEAAKKLYSTKCAKCHEFYDPKSYNQAEWNKWMQKMAKKSRLKADQAELLNRYLDTVRAGKPSEATAK